MRCTCNPDADSWLRKFLDWYIGADGLHIKLPKKEENKEVDLDDDCLEGLDKWLMNIESPNNAPDSPNSN